MRSVFTLLLAGLFTLTAVGCGGSNQVKTGEGGELKTKDPRAKHYDKEDAAPAETTEETTQQ
jgi:hypothetical protein